MLRIEEVLEEHQFDADVRPVLYSAQDRARGRKSLEICPEDLLVALTMYPETLGARILAAASITEENVEAIMVRMHHHRDRPQTIKKPVLLFHHKNSTEDLRLCVMLHQLINQAVDRQTDHHHNKHDVSTGDLVLGLALLTDDGVPCVLCEYGLSYVAVRGYLTLPEARV